MEFDMAIKAPEEVRGSHSILLPASSDSVCIIVRRAKVHKDFRDFTVRYAGQIAIRTLKLTISKRALVGACIVLAAPPLYAQAGGSPWENAVQVLQTAFTSTIARGLSLVAIVVGGLIFAFGEGQSKRTLAGIIFGVGMSIGAVNFMAWLFPG
jgi:type IV secretory pathway VirB2 component (pilin)